MSPLQETLRDYVALRRRLGCKFHAAEQRLNSFVKFMAQREAAAITYPLALEWAMQSPAARPTWALRFTDARGFSRYLHGRDPRTEVLPMRVLAFSGRAKPYLLTEMEIDKLLKAALALPPAKALRRWTYYSLFGLLAVTGLRIGEALALQQQDVDLKLGILTVRGAKFGKSRLVPLRSTTCAMLRRYAKSAMRISNRPAATTFSSPTEAVGFCTNMSIPCSGGFHGKSVYVVPRITPDLAFMTCDIVSPYRRWWVGIVPASRSRNCCPCSQLISDTSAYRTRIGICRPAPS